MGTDPWGFDEDRQVLARKLVTKRRQYSWSHTGVLLVYLAVLLAGWSISLSTWMVSSGLPTWLVSTGYLAILYTLVRALGWPYDYVGGYLLDRGFGLSTQTARTWAFDQVKSFALGLGAVVLAGDVLLWLLATQPVWWWTIAWILGLGVTVGLSFLAPVAIAPLFYKFRPLQDAAVRTRFEALAAKVGVPVIGVFEMGAAAKTRRSNAAVVGMGRTRRIVITDTMLRTYTLDEIETVLAHELGHQRFLDPIRGLAVGAAISFVMWSVAAWAYASTVSALGLTSIGDMAGLPLLLFWSGLVSTALGPLELGWSRRREARADRFSLETTGNPAAFASAMVRLHDSNLGVAHPTAWEKWLLYGHPPGDQRVEAARAFERRGTAAA